MFCTSPIQCCCKSRFCVKLKNTVTVTELFLSVRMKNEF